MADQKPALPVKDEIATAAKDIDIFSGWFGRLENPDPVLRSEAAGKGLKLYDEIARDAHAAAVLQTRYLAVIGREWEVLPPETGAKRVDKKNQEIADFVREAFAAANFDQARQEILQGVLYGFYAAEVIWAENRGRFVPGRLIAKHPRRFVFTPERELRLLTPGNMVEGEPVPERKFVVATFGSSDNPYGCGLGQKLWWPVWFKKHGIKFWMTFLEKFGMPTVFGKYPPGTEPDQQQKLLEALRAIQTDTAIKFPNTMEVDLLEASRTGQASYEGLCDFMDRQISKAVLGQTLTTEVKGEGSYAASQTHDEVRADIVKADADLLCECLNNTLVRWLVDLNFPGVSEYPKLWIRCEDEEDLQPLAERDKILAVDIGLPIPKRYFFETYGIPEPEGAEETLGGKPPEAAPENAKKTNGQGGKRGDREFAGARIAVNENRGLKSPLMQSDDIPGARLDALVEKTRQAADMGVLVEPIRRLLDQVESLEEFQDRLLDVYGDMDASALADLMEQAFTLAELAGRFDAGRR
jgi:phage gp29-like protein